MPAWTKNGSFIVYRRLRQDVVGFHQFITDNASNVNLNPDQLGAKMVGSWPSGAPLEQHPGEPSRLDRTLADPSLENHGVLDDDHINSFCYQQHDADAQFMPRPLTFASHTLATKSRRGKLNRIATASRGAAYRTVQRSNRAKLRTAANPFPMTVTVVRCLSAIRLRSARASNLSNAAGRIGPTSRTPTQVRRPDH